MKVYVFLLIASVIIAFHMVHTDATKFSFALPGRWGSQAKRGNPFSFSLPGRWGNAQKRGNNVNCGEYDPEVVYAVFSLLQQEGARLAECMNMHEAVENETHEKH